jgi:hypothetical protein
VSDAADDRILLREDGLAAERVSHFDSVPLILEVLRDPRAWWPFLRSRLRR